MKNTLLLTLACAICLATSVAPVAQAQCSQATGAGKWGFTINGQLITPGGPVSVAAVGSFTADIAGTLAGTETRSVGGGIANETIKGTFLIDADCTAKYTFDVYQGDQLSRSTKADVVFVGNGHEAIALFTSVVLPNGVSLPPLLSVTAKRMLARDGN